jgi:hypothetical protein
MSDPVRERPAVEVTARAREALLGIVAERSARHVRIHVGRG